MTIIATLCYIKDNGRTLMLHRNKKPKDIHKGKWNGLGGKAEAGESPEQCVMREVREESGLVIQRPALKGIITFPRFDGANDWCVFVFTATDFSGQLIDCPEGTLAWIEDAKIEELPLWEGDYIFLKWLDQPRIFSARFSYMDGKLQNHSVAFYPSVGPCLSS
ncbi:MAG: 8-oxo-dGTP diphosphatase [Candidatus Cloacimonetes bacterium]|nr:8-oxo-dGTP diphosphatase [Candidatus Cloacimonadota bacterium]